MPYPILATKLQSPRQRSRILERTALLHRLDRGLQDGRPLTLICAPAGYGKTTLITAWLAQLESQSTVEMVSDYLKTEKQPQAAWLSLDEQDDEINRLLAYLAASIKTIDTEACRSLSQVLNNPQPLPLETLFTMLVNDLAVLKQSIILVLDDVHLLQSEDTQRLIQLLSENIPPTLHLVLISRQEPFLPLGRLRSRNLITELRGRDLRFNNDEAGRFLSDCMQLDLDSNWIEELSRLTEGWATGLQLAGLSLQAQSDCHALIQNFQKNQHFVIDYLAGEVLNRLPLETRVFLYETSLLERFCPELCDHICQRQDSRHMLEELEEKNLFLISIDREESWYRYHHLFADMLRHNLRLERKPEEINPLHYRAAQWFNENGFTGEAIQHARSIPDWQLVTQIVLQHTNECFQQGNIRLLMGWMEDIPPDVITENPTLCNDYGWTLALTNRPEDADGYFIIAEQAFQDDNDRLGQILVGRSYLAYNTGKTQQCLDLGNRAMELLADENQWMRSVCRLTMGMAHWELLEFQACREDMQAVLQAGSHAAGRNRISALSYLGDLSMIQMDFDKAQEYLEKAITPVAGGKSSPGSDVAFTFLSYLTYEFNQLEEARYYIENGLMLCRVTGNDVLQASQKCQLARIYRALGQTEEARQTLNEASELLRRQPQHSIKLPFMKTIEAELALDRHDTDTAADLLRQMESDIHLPYLAYPGLVHARYLLQIGETLQAETLLKQLYRRAETASWPITCYRINLMQSTIQPGREKSRQLLIKCLEQAAPIRLIRPFLDLREPMYDALAQANLRMHAPHLVQFANEIIQVATQYDTGIIAAPSNVHTISINADDIEPLTDRELDVLRLLVEETGYDEIANRLVLSTNTVKSHIKHIYGKLGVSSRREALARARQLQLI